MYIRNKTNNYPCMGYFPTDNAVRFTGVEGLTLPISGEIRLVSEDNNLILAIQDCGDYARQTCVDGVLTLTNEPEPFPPEPWLPPEPPAPTDIELLQTENKTLKAQVTALSDNQDFYEECIVEMAAIVYA